MAKPETDRAPAPPGALPPPPALMRCRRPSLAGAGESPDELGRALDVRAGPDGVVLVEYSPARAPGGVSGWSGRKRLLAIILPVAAILCQTASLTINTRGIGAIIPGAVAVGIVAVFILTQLALSPLGRGEQTLLTISTARGEAWIATSGTRLPLSQVRGVQLLHGVADTRTSNIPVRQIVILTHGASTGWMRHLVHADLAGFSPERARALAAFGRAAGLAAEAYRIRGWRTPAEHLFRNPRNGLPETPEPLGDGRTIDAWRADGNDPFDSVPELVHLSASTPECRRCGYSLDGLDDPAACPECGTDFRASPLART